MAARANPDSYQDDDDKNRSGKDHDDTARPKMKRRPIPRIVELERRDRHHLGSTGPGTSTKK